MRFSQLFIIVSLLMLVALTACQSGSTTPPVNFDRLTATVSGSDGMPLSGLAVRVEGRDTGVVTNALGGFELTRGAFPRGVETQNEISLGRNGVIVGTRTVVPVENPIIAIQFGDPGTTGNPGSVEGNIFDDQTGEALSGVEVTLFSEVGGVLTTTSNAGHYSFADVSPGAWQIAAYLDSYHPKMAMVIIEDDQNIVQHLALTPQGSIGSGEGLVVRGVLLDSKTNAPVANATVTMYADTGYYGLPEPMMIDDVDEWNSNGEVAVGFAGEPSKDPSTVAPFIYDPQYQETTTDASGNFVFPNEVVGYTIWLEAFSDGYLNGSHYEQIEGQTGVLNLELTIEPFVETTISGIVVDELGEPVKGSYVEFIFGGGYNTLPMDMAVPGDLDWEGIAEDGSALFNSFGTPPPSPDAGGSNGEEWQNWDDAEASMPMAGDMGGVETDGFFGGPNVDNELMQRFRYEHQNEEKAGSFTYFDGYYSTTTGDDGTFEFSDVPAGQYYVFASAYRHLNYDKNMEVFENPDDNDVTITLPNVPVGSVEGFIVDDQGNPIDDVLVNATQPFVDPFTYSDATGYYRIDNIPVGNWRIGAYKKGYLTNAEQTDITEDTVVKINLTIPVYNPPAPTLIPYTGHVVNGNDNSHVSGVDLVFTPVNDEYGGYFQHVVSDGSGAFAAQMIPTEYNVLIQREGYEDLYIRIWVDALYPQMDFWLWPIGAGGGGGGRWGGMDDGMLIEPMPAMMPDMPPPQEF